ncbi:hypothetical protein KKE33_04275 [Patescibacteria group bacterium]|nr:hypothetical protein [Patescibacteria group bacterium]
MKSKNRIILAVTAPFIVIILDLCIWFIFDYILVNKMGLPYAPGTAIFYANLIFSAIFVMAILAIPLGIVYGIALRSKAKAEDETVKVKSNL